MDFVEEWALGFEDGFWGKRRGLNRHFRIPKLNWMYKNHRNASDYGALAGSNPWFQDDIIKKRDLEASLLCWYTIRGLRSCRIAWKATAGQRAPHGSLAPPAALRSTGPDRWGRRPCGFEPLLVVIPKNMIDPIKGSIIFGTPSGVRTLDTLIKRGNNYGAFTKETHVLLCVFPYRFFRS